MSARRSSADGRDPGQPQLIHWSIADPAGEADPRAAFRRVAAELRTRIAFLLARLGE